MTEATSTETEKLELSTPLESYLLGLGILGVLLGIYSYLSRHPLGLESYCLGLGVLFIVLRMLVDNHYIVDYPRRQILYHFKFAGYKDVRPVVGFADILAVVVQGERRRSCWVYYPALLTRTGKIVIVADSTFFPVAQKRAGELAEKFATQALEAQPERVLRWRKGQAVYETFSEFQRVLPLVAISVVLILAILGVGTVFHWL